MNLKLQWKNINTISVTTEIYRGDAPLDRANLTNPLVTLTNGEVEWIDTNTIRGNLYYYVFVTKTANDRSVSVNYPIYALPRRGPGSVELLYGDYEIGFFGTLESIDFITTQKLVTAIGLKGANGADVNINDYSPTWLKFVRKGKIIFVPDNALILTNMSYKTLYDAGLIYGVSGPGPFRPFSSVDRDQNTQIKIGADTFIVRVMKGALEDVSQLVPGGSVTTPEGNCEWNDFIYPQFKVVPPDQRLVNILPDNNYGLSLVSGRGAICQECASIGNGATPGNFIGRGATYSALNRTHVTQRYATLATQSDNCAWIPVLELVE